MYAEPFGVDVGALAGDVKRGQQLERVFAAPVFDDGVGEFEAVGRAAARVDEQDDVTGGGDDLVQRVKAFAEDAVRAAVDVEYERITFGGVEIGREDEAAGDGQVVALEFEVFDAAGLVGGEVVGTDRGEAAGGFVVFTGLLRDQFAGLLGRGDDGGDAASVGGDVDGADQFGLFADRFGELAAAGVDAQDGGAGAGVGGEDDAVVGPADRRRGREGKRAALRGEIVVGQAGLHAAVASDGVEVGLLAFSGMGEGDDEAASVGRPGGASGGDDAGGEALDFAAVGGHDAEFAAERSAALALGRAVGGEGDPASIGRGDGVGVVV